MNSPGTPFSLTRNVLIEQRPVKHVFHFPNTRNVPKSQGLVVRPSFRKHEARAGDRRNIPAIQWLIELGSPSKHYKCGLDIARVPAFQ